MCPRRDGSLRERAERLVREREATRPVEPASPERMAEMVHELEVHQAELELQNESLREAEQALVRARDLYFDLFDLAPMAYVTLAADGTVRDANLSAAALLGCDRKSLRGRSFAAFLERAEASRFHAYVQAVIESGERGVLEISLRRRNGDVVPARLESLAGPGPKGEDRLRMAVIDLSEIRSAQEEVQEKEAERRQLEEELRQAQKLEAIGTLASGVAHDFNNLLMGVRGCADIAQNSIPADSPARMFLDEITRSADSGAAITRQLLAFSRKQKVEVAVFDLEALIERDEKMLRRLLGEDIDIDLELAAEDSRVETDPGQLEQVLMNLAVNAKDAMPEGGRLRMATRNWAVPEENSYGLPPGDYVCVTVADTGTGMSEETRQRIFEPFYTTKEAGRGTGLGLSTVYGIVRGAGGHIDVQSEPGAGTRFEILLPVARRAETEAVEIPESKFEELPQGTGTILVLEDERSVRMAIRYYLEEAGYRVLEAASGAVAIECCERYPGPVDLVLTDVVLPGMSGPAAIDRLRALKPGAAVLFMSAHAAETLEDRGILGEGALSIQKPFGAESLAAAVREALRGREQAGEG